MPIARVSVSLSLSLIVSNVRSKVSRSLPQLCRTHGWGASQLNQSSIRSQHSLHFTSTYPQNLHIHPPKLKLQLVSRFCGLQQCTWIIELLWRCRWCECEWIQIQIWSITVSHHIYNTYNIYIYTIYTYVYLCIVYITDCVKYLESALPGHLSSPDSCLLSLTRLQNFAPSFASQTVLAQLLWGGAPLRATRASLRSSVRTRTFNVGHLVNYRWNLMKYNEM